MIVNNTPVEHHPNLGLWVKREDLSCPPPGPPFSKTRGVYAHIKNRPEKVIGVLDTYHSQAGHAVATACALLGKKCVNYYPVYKKDTGTLRPQQQAAKDLGATLVPLKATASWALYHEAKKDLAACHPDSYCMPNALKLPETVSETAAEVARTVFPAGVDTILIAASSGTIASGVIRGLIDNGWNGKQIVLHMGYSRPHGAVLQYIHGKVDRPKQWSRYKYILIDEGYAYKDKATDRDKTISAPPFPCNPYYDLKLYHWWIKEGFSEFEEAILWNIG